MTYEEAAKKILAEMGEPGAAHVYHQDRAMMATGWKAPIREISYIAWFQIDRLTVLNSHVNGNSCESKDLHESLSTILDRVRDLLTRHPGKCAICGQPLATGVFCFKDTPAPITTETVAHDPSGEVYPVAGSAVDRAMEGEGR